MDGPKRADLPTKRRVLVTFGDVFATGFWVFVDGHLLILNNLDFEKGRFDTSGGYRGVGVRTGIRDQKNRGQASRNEALWGGRGAGPNTGSAEARQSVMAHERRRIARKCH